jgi:hypothetical protein
MYRSLVHEPCGGYLPDTTGPDAADRYVVDLPTRCEKCTAVSEAVEAHMKGDHAPHPEALLWYAHPAGPAH